MEKNLTIPTADDISKMSRTELISTLTGMLPFARYSYDNYLSPIDETEKKYRKLEADRKPFHVAWLVAAVLIVIALLCQLGEGFFSYDVDLESIISVFKFLFLGAAAFIILVNIIYGIIYWNATWRYKKSRRAAAEKMEALTREWSRVMNETHVRDMEYGMAVLPDYFLYPPALEYMLKCLRNQQAATLGEAVTLYEQHEDRDKIMQQMKQLEKTIRQYGGTTNQYTTVYQRF